MPAVSEAQRRMLNARSGRQEEDEEAEEAMKKKKGGRGKKMGKGAHSGVAHPHFEVAGKDPHASAKFHQMNAQMGMPDGHAAGPEQEEGPEGENEECGY